MSSTVLAITQFSITLICGLLFFTAFRKRHHRIFFIMILPAITSLIFGLQLLGVLK